MEAVGERTGVTDAGTRTPAEHELRCEPGPLGGGIFGRRPMALLGLTAASNVALVAEFVVRLAGLVERDHAS